jgi:hypothetical protein
MPATGSAAYGMYAHNAALPEIVCTLSEAGFEKQNICMVLSPTHPMATALRNAKFASAEPNETAQSARMIGWFSEFGAVVIPAVGFFVRSQKFLSALMTEQSPPTLCGGSKMLAGLGFSTNEALRLHRALGDAGALVFVSCNEAAKSHALEALRSMGAREVASLEENRAAAAVA